MLGPRSFPSEALVIWFRSFVFLALSAIATNALAAPCDRGYVLTLGAVNELTRYNGAHQPTGKLVSTIVSSVTKGDTVTAVASVDNYLGANKASTSTVDLVCDGKTVSMNVRNDNAMKDFYGKAASDAAAKGQKLLAATSFSEPQIYPLDMKVGDELPAFRAYSIVVVQKAPPDWGKMAATGDWGAALAYAIDHKYGGGVQIVTMHIKVVGQEACAIPDGKSVPCFHISKDVFSKPIASKDDLNKAINVLAKGVVTTQVNEWFAPGVGGVKMEIGPAGKPVVTMALTSIKR